MLLMELQNPVSLDEIYGLSKIIDLDELGKERHYGIQDSSSCLDFSCADVRTSNSQQVPFKVPIFTTSSLLN
jgi:hypothetical protein